MILTEFFHLFQQTIFLLVPHSQLHRSTAPSKRLLCHNLPHLSYSDHCWIYLLIRLIIENTCWVYLSSIFKCGLTVRKGNGLMNLSYRRFPGKKRKFGHHWVIKSSEEIHFIVKGCSKNCMQLPNTTHRIQ